MQNAPSASIATCSSGRLILVSVLLVQPFCAFSASASDNHRHEMLAPATRASPVSATEAAGTEPASNPQLRTVGRFADGDLEHLDSAFQLAAERLRRDADCRSLFEALGADGESLLARSSYVRAALHEEKKICRSRVVAFTGVGSSVTRLCRGFSRLDEQRGALILLHEALHFAGQDESPHRQGAPTSSEINARVAASCGL